MTRVVVDLSLPLGPQLMPAVHLLRRHRVVAFPTDTLYGLAADPQSRAALDELMALKGRTAEKSIALVAASLDQARTVAVIEGDALRLAKRFWPGPLTLVVPARGGVREPVRSASGFVGVRVPAHPVAIALADAAGTPLTATSANPSGVTATATPDDLERLLPALEMTVDAGILAGGPPSTVIQLDGGSVQVLRDGAIPASRVLESLVRTE